MASGKPVVSALPSVCVMFAAVAAGISEKKGELVG